MTTEPVTASGVDRAELRLLVQEKYEDVAQQPELGFHFHNGRPLAEMLGYPAEVLDSLPQGTVDSFAGTGNPFSMGALNEGDMAAAKAFFSQVVEKDPSSEEGAQARATLDALP